MSIRVRPSPPFTDLILFIFLLKSASRPGLGDGLSWNDAVIRELAGMNVVMPQLSL